MVTAGIVHGPVSTGRGAVYRPTPRLLEARDWLEARVKHLQEHFRESPALTNSNYREIFSVPASVAKRELSRLVAEGFLTRTGTRRGARYVEGPALRN